jgi:hypothetical protein
VTRTNVFTLTTVLVRVLALYFLILTAIQFGGQLMLYFVADWSRNDMVFALAFVAILVLLGGLWLFADLVARAALARPDGEVFDSTLEAAAWREIGFALLGVWFAMRGSIDLVVQLFRHWQVNRSLHEYGSEAEAPALIPDAIESILTLAAGIVLLFGARALSRLLQRLRGR